MEEAAQKDPTGLGARIREARLEAGLTQDELSDLVGVGMRQIQYYESGESNPYRKLRQIAEATGSSVGWLLHGDSSTELAAEEIAQRLDSVAEAQERVEGLLRELLRRLPDAPADAQSP